MPTARWLETMATTQEHKKERDVLPTQPRPNEEKAIHSIPRNPRAVNQPSAPIKVRTYMATFPDLYAFSVPGFDAVNMCYLCPRAPECAVTKNTTEQYASPDGCTREDVPSGDDARWLEGAI